MYSGSSTTIVMPCIIRGVVPLKEHIDIGIFYYIYMGMMANMCFRYPARIFVGDTFCYWAGMTLATTCIIGHFSKTMALFWIPQARIYPAVPRFTVFRRKGVMMDIKSLNDFQIFNFIYSTPQLFHLVPCPRHRLPKFDQKTNTVDMSIVQFKERDIETKGKVVINVLDFIGLLYRETFEKDGERYIAVNNLTLINLVLKFTGPMHEEGLTVTLLGIQILSSFFAFFIRFYVASLMYDIVR
ncbi:unnamed protein product [Gongylonema pulchrum]|uniref:Uncharacterized protein n=1 Tax=Gongylonema pulchrum TaxID=637853 RepID=A0A3P6NTT2_9BILA|nr:unnamed protein product [Gongylonema pulchrum]